MRGIALSLAAVSGLGVVLLGGGAIAGSRDDRAQPVTKASSVAPAPEAAAGPVWFGGTLAPIVVTAAPPKAAVARRTHDCVAAGS